MSTGSFERKAAVFFIFLTVVFQAEQEKLEVKTEFKINHSKYVLEASVYRENYPKLPNFIYTTTKDLHRLLIQELQS